MTLFDAYLMVDWSANKTPKRGEDSIWYFLLIRQNGVLQEVERRNPTTRLEAECHIRRLLDDNARKSLRTLVGFDFPYGYPSGFAKSLGFAGKERWRHNWNLLCREIEDQSNNNNNRFEVAARLNQRISRKPFPFWGCPSQKQTAFVSSCKLHPYTARLPELRITDGRAKGLQPVWKLFYPGSVGSQALTGIPCVARLRDDPKLVERSRVWPFETGLRPLPSLRKTNWLIVHTEIFPALVPPAPKPGEVRDEAQVRTLSEFFADADERGRLSEFFAGWSGLTTEQRQDVEAEEGWILGVQ